MIERLFILFVKNRILIGILLVIVTGIILFLTLVPSEHLGESELYNYDKLGHFLLFFTWTFIFGLFMFSLKHKKASLLLIFIIGAGFGVTIEIMQGIMPFNRNPNVYDAIADIAGSLTATILLYFVKERLYFRKVEQFFKKFN
jgi:VanZ family protein